MVSGTLNNETLKPQEARKSLNPEPLYILNLKLKALGFRV